MARCIADSIQLTSMRSSHFSGKSYFATTETVSATCARNGLSDGEESVIIAGTSCARIWAFSCSGMSGSFYTYTRQFVSLSTIASTESLPLPISSLSCSLHTHFLPIEPGDLGSDREQAGEDCSQSQAAPRACQGLVLPVFVLMGPEKPAGAEVRRQP